MPRFARLAKGAWFLGQRGSCPLYLGVSPLARGEGISHQIMDSFHGSLAPLGCSKGIQHRRQVVNTLAALAASPLELPQPEAGTVRHRTKTLYS